MQNKKQYIKCIFLLLVFSFEKNSLINAQTALGKPEAFDRPLDYSADETKAKNFIKTGTRNKKKTEGWLVYSDRDDNPMYEKASESSSHVNTASFRDHFYVTKEEEDFLYIVQASSPKGNGNLKLMNVAGKQGWVRKEKLLLWNSGLVDPQSYIHRKVFVLKRRDNIEEVIKQKKEVASIFSGPVTKKHEDTLRIFDFFFVLKKENGRFLIARQANILPHNRLDLVGWIQGSECADWNSRLCMEPNYDSDAFQERKNNPTLRFKVFENPENAKNFIDNPNEPNAAFTDDPVTFELGKMSNTNPRRYNGEVLRMPLLGSLEGGTVFKTGLIGTIKVKSNGQNSVIFESELEEREFSTRKITVDKVNKKANSINVFFLVEGTDSIYGYKNTILEAMEKVNNKFVGEAAEIKYGALIYRDIPEDDRITECKPLTMDFDEVKQFIIDSDFRNKKDKDSYTALYYGLSQAIKKGRFNEDETNIIIMIGANADFIADDDRMNMAKQMKHPAYLNEEEKQEVFESLSKYQAHLYAIQLRNFGNKSSEIYVKTMHKIMLNVAKISFNREYGNSASKTKVELLKELEKRGWKVNEPEIPQPPYLNEEVQLRNGIYPGALIAPKRSKSIGVSQLGDILVKFVSTSIGTQKDVQKIINDVYTNGNNLSTETAATLKIDAGRLAPALAMALNGLNLSQNNLLKSLGEKYKLYIEGYIPLKLNSAEHDLIKYVLFMPQSDLLFYKSIIDRCLSDASTGDKKREGLAKIYKEIITQFSGELQNRNKRPEDWTREEITRLIQGIYNTGFKTSVDLNVRVKDITNERIVSDKEVDKLINQFKIISTKLKKIIELGSDYDFSYSSGESNTYYWIDMSEVSF